MDRQLAARLPDEVAWVRPGLPSRLPFRSRTVTSHRQYALNKYLHKMLLLVDGCTMARRTLLNFVSRSHMHWMYANDAVLLAPPTIATRSKILRAARRSFSLLAARAKPYTPPHTTVRAMSDAPLEYASSCIIPTTFTDFKVCCAIQCLTAAIL